MADGIAYQYLEQLQAQTYASLGLTVRAAVRDYRLIPGYRAALIATLTTRLGRTPTDAEVEGNFERVLTAQREMLASAPTRYEQLDTFLLLTDLAAEIEKAVATGGFALPSKPLLGTLATGRVNALTMAVPGSADHLVVLERQLFAFADAVSTAVAQAWPPLPGEHGDLIALNVDPDVVAESIRGDEDAVRRFTESVIAYATTGTPSARQHTLRDPSQETLHTLLRDATNLFVVGHEYGHVIARHLDGAVRRAGVLPTTVATEQLDYAWAQEFEADAIGARLSATAMSRHKSRFVPAGAPVDVPFDLGLSYSGGELFLSSMEIMDRAVSLLEHGDEAARTLGSHPPHDLRRKALRRAVIDRSGERAEPVVRLGEAVRSTVHTMWQHSRQALLRLHQRGVRPGRMWTIARERQS